MHLFLILIPGLLDARLFHRPSGSIWSHPSCDSSVSPSRRTRHFQPTPAPSSQRTRSSFPLPEPSDPPRFKHLKTRHFPRIPLQIQRSRKSAPRGQRAEDAETKASSELRDDIVTFSWVNPPQKICLGCLLVSNRKKAHGRFSMGLCWKDYASHLAWEHLWIPQEDLEQAARKREVQIPLWASPDGRAENRGWMRNFQFQPPKSLINTRCFTLKTVC